MKLLYFDCFAGIAGDMTVGALLDLGVPLAVVTDALALLPLPAGSYGIATERTSRKGIGATRFVVDVGDDQPHRHYAHIDAMIRESSLAEGVKDRACRIFRKLAEAEAKVHGVPVERVHFHEVGAIDSIVDIVATAACLDHLGIDRIAVSPLPLGSGYIETAHGRLPVPAPATAELLMGLPVHSNIGPGERVTPTGAAIVASLAEEFGPAPAMTVGSIGYGAGTKDFPDLPNLLRVVMGETADTECRDTVRVLETHIDDMNPEILGFLMERLFAAGALDVAFSPLQMKKNRPATRLTIISPPDRLEELARLVLLETTAAGVRHYPAERIKLERSQETRPTSLGQVKVKCFRQDGRTVRVAAEYEECRRLAEERGLPLREVYALVERETAGT